MTPRYSRRDFLKLGGLSAASLAFAPLLPKNLGSFDDSDVVRVASASVSVYSEPSDQSRITGTWYKDDLIHVYEEVVAKEPTYNPVWYRVWGGYVHRARLQRVKNIPNTPLDFIAEGTRRMSEVTVPFTQPWRLTKTRGWEMLNPRLYFESVHLLEAVEEGPDGTPWYRIFDELTGIYYARAMDFRVIPNEELAPISPEVPWENKRVDVNLATQILTAYEYEKIVFQTNISSGIPAGRTNPKELSTKTPDGEFHIQEKMQSKHMGNGNLLADADGYELPGVPWTCFFTDAGHAFHGTYWHENYGTPMSHGCINMRTSEAKWLFRWARPLHNTADLSSKYYFRGYGTTVTIHY
jgi:hypothetical protein